MPLTIRPFLTSGIEVPTLAPNFKLSACHDVEAPLELRTVGRSLALGRTRAASSGPLAATSL
jgi:hypothetical protein